MAYILQAQSESMKCPASSQGSSRFPENKKTLGTRFVFSSDTTFSKLGALLAVRDHCLSVLALYWKGTIGNKKLGTGIEDRGPVIGDR